MLGRECRQLHRAVWNYGFGTWKCRENPPQFDVVWWFIVMFPINKNAFGGYIPFSATPMGIWLPCFHMLSSQALVSLIPQVCVWDHNAPCSNHDFPEHREADFPSWGRGKTALQWSLVPHLRIRCLCRWDLDSWVWLSHQSQSFIIFN